MSLPVTARTGKTAFSNAMLITHRGLSGPAILQIPNYWQPGDALELDLLPGVDALAVLSALQRERPAAELRTVLGELFPKRWAQRLCETVFDSKPMRQYPPKALKAIAEQLARFPLVCSGTEGYRTAEVTLGGVADTGRQRACGSRLDQLASALAINAQALVTHDRDFSRVRGLPILA